MNHFTKQNLRIEKTDDRYGPSSFSITLSTEVLTISDIGKITNILQASALHAGFELNMTTDKFEVPENEEEIAAVKAAQEADEEARKQQEAARREELVAKVILKASESDVPYHFAIQDAIDDLSSWDQSPVRKMLKERNRLLTLFD